MMRWLATTGPRTGSFLCSSTPWLCGRLDKLNVNQLACKVSLCWFMLFQGMRKREARMPLVWCVVSKRGLKIKHREVRVNCAFMPTQARAKTKRQDAKW